MFCFNLGCRPQSRKTQKASQRMTTVSHTPEKRTRVASVTPSPVGKTIEKSNTTTTNECSPSNGSGKTNANEEDSFDPICQLQPEIGDRVFCKHKNGYWYWGTVKDKFWKRKFLYYSVSRYDIFQVCSLLVEKGGCFLPTGQKKDWQWKCITLNTDSIRRWRVRQAAQSCRRNCDRISISLQGWCPKHWANEW